eukprot:COSAG04_NODE_2571_length_3910_cov_2.053267_1_plen_139_part_00
MLALTNRMEPDVSTAATMSIGGLLAPSSGDMARAAMCAMQPSRCSSSDTVSRSSTPLNDSAGVAASGGVSLVLVTSRPWTTTAEEAPPVVTRSGSMMCGSSASVWSSASCSSVDRGAAPGSAGSGSPVNHGISGGACW